MHEPAPTPVWVVVAGAAGVPSSMMDLITHVREVQSRDNLDRNIDREYRQSR